jgi:hypothetical protein
MNFENHHSPGPDPATRHRRQRHSSKFGQWLYKARSSKRERLRIIQLIAIVAAVLIAFAAGYYYFGPSFTFSDG